MHAFLGLPLAQGRAGSTKTLQFFWPPAIACDDYRCPPPATRPLESVIAWPVSASLPGLEYHFLQRGNAMDVLWEIAVSVGHAIEQVLIYVETHHWIFGFLAGGYIFYLHDRGLHARFDALDKRIDEIRKRLAVEY